jgi:hypothetical protein
MTVMDTVNYMYVLGVHTNNICLSHILLSQYVERLRYSNTFIHSTSSPSKRGPACATTRASCY